MEENRADIVTDKVKNIVSKVQAKLERDYKNTKKFRKEPLTSQEQAVIYASLTQQDIVEGMENSTKFYQQRISEMLNQYPQEKWAELQARMYTPEEMAIEDMNEYIYEQEKILRRYENA